MEKKNSRSILYTIIGALSALCFVCICIIVHERRFSYTQKIFNERLELTYQSAKNDLVQEIDNYIQLSSNNTSCLNALTLIDACDEYDIDIIFVLAQGEVEGHFATRGLSSKMNNVFNVGAHDGKGTKYMRHYDHPDLSITPFLDLLKRNYLVNGKNEKDLMHKYVDCHNQRYASDSKYEDKIFEKYQYIKENTMIDSLYCIYKKYYILTER